MNKIAQQKFTVQSPYQKLERDYRRIMKTPAQQAAILALLAGGTSYLAYPFAKGIFSALVRPFGMTAGQQPPKTRKQLQQQKQRDKRNKVLLAGISAALAAGTSAYVTRMHRFPRGGSWTTWPTLKQPVIYSDSSGLVKESAYVPEIPQAMNTLINTQQAMDLFRGDPVLRKSNPYAMNLGTSIVAAAGNGRRNTTVGSVFDSAVNKIETKFSAQGMLDGALRTGAAYTTASLFTNAIGSMMGLPRQTRQNIISAGTWAGAISSILG